MLSLIRDNVIKKIMSILENLIIRAVTKKTEKCEKEKKAKDETAEIKATRKFERLLIREIERRKEAHFSICQKFEHEIAERKTKIKKEQEKLMTDVVEALSKTQETDIARRREIWQDYDGKIQQMNRAFLDELDILFSKLTVQHI